ncbi:MAG: signal peptidase II [Planctomycetota bacterium]
MPRQAGTGGFLRRLPLIFWVVAAVTAAADLCTKYLIFRRLPSPDSTPIVIIDGFIRIVHSENRGGVFGLAQGSAAWLIFGLAAGALVIWFAHRKENRAVLLQIALGFIMAGAVGNVYDRLAYGHVRDFVDVCYWPGQHWPAFNVADSGICVGAAYLVVHAFFFMSKDKKRAKGRAEHRG